MGEGRSGSQRNWNPNESLKDEQEQTCTSLFLRWDEYSVSANNQSTLILSACKVNVEWETCREKTRDSIRGQVWIRQATLRSHPWEAPTAEEWWDQITLEGPLWPQYGKWFEGWQHWNHRNMEEVPGMIQTKV